MGILITDFSMATSEWTPVTDFVSFSVDVTDSIYNISTSGTYFIYNGTQVTPTFSNISNGYALSYSPPTPSGSIELTVHAENDNSESSEEDYNFLFGYAVDFINEVDWGANEQVLVTMDAYNDVYCPNLETDAYYFTTVDWSRSNIGAFIRAIPPFNLSAALYPQNKFFFLDRTYTVIISGIKDFHGNTLQPFTFSFTIQR